MTMESVLNNIKNRETVAIFDFNGPNRHFGSKVVKVEYHWPFCTFRNDMNIGKWVYDIQCCLEYSNEMVQSCCLSWKLFWYNFWSVSTRLYLTKPLSLYNLQVVFMQWTLPENKWLWDPVIFYWNYWLLGNTSASMNNLLLCSDCLSYRNCIHSIISRLLNYSCSCSFRLI